MRMSLKMNGGDKGGRSTQGTEKTNKKSRDMGSTAAWPASHVIAR
jgi:hypothetical protein